MSITAIMLGELKFNPNVFSGRIRKVIAPEMRVKSQPAISRKGSNQGKINAALCRANSAAILKFLADGKRYKLVEISAAANLADTTTTRHLRILAVAGKIMTSASTVRGSRVNPTTFWIKA